MNKVGIKESFRSFLKQFHKRESTSSQYISNMEKVEEWFKSEGICSQDFDIWTNIEEIPVIQASLKSEKLGKWRKLNNDESGWYSAPWNKWVAFNELFKDEKDFTNTVGEIIDHIHKFISHQGFCYTKEEITNFYLSLKAKPFVILAGISGTGKTQLPKRFAKAIGMANQQIIQVPVRPDWTDSSDLLGYTGIDGTFKPKDLTWAIKKAKEEDEKPFFFILDEMNLARVEHYFSDFLSVIESREWLNGKGSSIITPKLIGEEVIQTTKKVGEFSDISWPDNLYLIGTVNMDETTHAFSRKVLDRANSIEMNEVDLNWINCSKETINPLNDISNGLLKTEYLNSNDILQDERELIAEEMELLKEVNQILKDADLHFAYRVRDETAFYLLLNSKNDLLPPRTAMDFQLIQKVLPRIHGSSERVQAILVKLLNLLEGTTFRVKDFDIEQIEKRMDTNSLKYPRSSRKITFMLKRYEDDRFTSFWL